MSSIAHSAGECNPPTRNSSSVRATETTLLHSLSMAELGVWLSLSWMAAESPIPDTILYTRDRIPQALELTEEDPSRDEIRDMMDKFCTIGILQEIPGGYKFVKPRRPQDSPERVRERVAACRQRRREACNTAVTPTKHSVTPPCNTGETHSVTPSNTEVTPETPVTCVTGPLDDIPARAYAGLDSRDRDRDRESESLIINIKDSRVTTSVSIPKAVSTQQAGEKPPSPDDSKIWSQPGSGVFRFLQSKGFTTDEISGAIKWARTWQALNSVQHPISWLLKILPQYRESLRSIALEEESAETPVAPKPLSMNERILANFKARHAAAGAS